MKKDFKKMIIEKGQGLTEYVLILAFIAGIAFMMFGGNGSLKGTLANTLTQTVDTLAGLFGEDDGYITASKDYYRDKFHDWSGKSSEYLAGQSRAERLKADQEGLALIASFFLDLRQSEVAALMGVDVSDDNKGFSNTHSELQWVFDNLNSDRMGPGTGNWSDIMVPLSYWNKSLDTEGYLWLECGKNKNLIKEMAGSDNTVNYKKDKGESQLRSRVFYSDGMIGEDSSERAVALRVHYNDDGKVDQVWVAAQTGTSTEYKYNSNNTKVVEKKDNAGNTYTDSPGNSALNGNSTSIQGLDLIVTGPKDNYKYKVNN